VPSSLRQSTRRETERFEIPPSRRHPAIAPPFEVGRAIRVGAIHNPQSGRNARRKSFRSVAAVLAAHPELISHEVDRVEDIWSAADELARRSTELIIVNGGDGTVQAVLTALLKRPPEEPMPLLAILPGGTTNMTAGDVNAGWGSPRQLRHLLDSARSGRLPGPVVGRPVMEVRLSRSGPPLFGMFFGAGAIYHGIRFCRGRIHTLGVRGETGPGLAVAVFVARVLSGRGGTLFPPLHASVAVDGRELAATPYFGLLTTTLEHLFLGLRPFWADGAAPLRFTGLRYSLQHKLRAAVPVMRGKANPYLRPELGYESHNANEIVLCFDSGFTLDGELFDPRPGQSVVLRGGAVAYFLSHAR
jgi:diacylglycerol kinase (ATP)